jgi:hypothetical protein
MPRRIAGARQSWRKKNALESSWKPRRQSQERQSPRRSAKKRVPEGIIAMPNTDDAGNTKKLLIFVEVVDKPGVNVGFFHAARA